jgi:diguanylate cyclase (GGDEF)-like protein
VPRSPLLRHGAYLLLTLAIFWANVATPGPVKLGLFYLVPVLYVTWNEGAPWGVLYMLLGMALRIRVEMTQVGSPLSVVTLNQVSFGVVAGITIFAFQHIRRNEGLLRDLATHDQLTRVFNARAFTERLADELRRVQRYHRPLALLYLDLDDFKQVNDSHGHQTGDAVLRLVAEAIRHAVRQADVVGRMGGDEFAVLMPETEPALATAAADRLAAGLRSVLNGSPAVTASIGVVAPITQEADTDAILRRADQAMYEAKKTGKNRVVAVSL